ncbi:hypothetical protein DFJ74DRAFT_693791 [Hyaloraphidium curvatum]|nr:hypothetical protein DFJ74DRAFT_693791 [Hyaloraphidium curvatum]
MAVERAPDGAAKPVERAGDDVTPAKHPWIADWKELVAPAACVAAVVAFNKSSYGRRWYEGLAARQPNKERLAKKLFFGITATVNDVAFWVPTLAFLALDALQPKWLTRYRLQKDKPPPGAVHLLKTFAVSYVMQYYVGAIMQVKAMYPLWRRNVKDVDLVKMPSAVRTVLEFLFSEILAEIIFYVTHLLFHTKYLYQWVHKRHHENRTPFTLATLYTDPIDILFNNVPTGSLPTAIIGAHPTTLWAFNIWRNLHGVMVHCGYDLPGITDVRHHDWHHRKFDGNYGIYAGIITLDRIFGTTSPSYLKWLTEWNRKRDPLTHLELKEEPAVGRKEADADGKAVVA